MKHSSVCNVAHNMNVKLTHRGGAFPCLFKCYSVGQSFKINKRSGSRHTSISTTLIQCAILKGRHAWNSCALLWRRRVAILSEWKHRCICFEDFPEGWGKAMHTACPTIQFHFAHFHTAPRARALCAQDGLNKSWVQGRRLYVYACYCIAD